MKYREAYDKIIEAYFKDEIKPGEPEFCFCGTLCDGSKDWFISYIRHEHRDSHGYTGKEFVRMEAALLGHTGVFFNPSAETSEDRLFAGMSAALDVLKQIHIERGEVIDETPVFTKRQLQLQK